MPAHRYLEESLKICCALNEFEVGERVFGTRPAVVGFREHIFSGPGDHDESLAEAELIAGVPPPAVGTLRPGCVSACWGLASHVLAAAVQ